MKDPAFLFYASDFLGGVSDLTMEERGQYITMLCLQQQKGAVSEKTTRLVFGNNLSPDVLAKFERDENGDLYNVRLRLEMDKRMQFIEKQSSNGKKGGAPTGNSNAKKTTQKQPKNNPKTTNKENENINENIDGNIDENIEGGTGGDSTDMITVDTKTCKVSGDGWRKSFDAYLSGLRQCYNILRKDEAWMAERKRLNPGVNVALTLEKCCLEFWATEAGWQNKKGKRIKSIDWKQTLTTAISQKQNKVYDNGTGNNQTQRRGNALTVDYLTDLARRAMSVDGVSQFAGGSGGEYTGAR